MKKYAPCLFILFFSTTVFAQKIEEEFTKALDFYRDEEYDSALIIYEHIYNKGKGDESLVAKSYYNMGNIYTLKKDYKKAKPIFETIINSDYDEMDEGGRGEGLMAEPYALYRNNSCKSLAEIALEEKNYSRALKYTKLFDKIYPYKHFCGNEYAANSIYVAYTYARSYIGLEQIGAAIAVLLPVCMYNGLAENDDIVKLACQLIQEHYSKEQIQKELEKAVAGITSKIKGKGKRKYDYYCTKIFGTEVELYLYARKIYDNKQDGLKDKELYEYCFTNSAFYKSLLQ